MSRYLAAFWHLLMSLIVLGFVVYLIKFVWYPDFFYSIDGGRQGLGMITGVHLVLGPLLTLIVFKAGKAGLGLDLTIIGFVQTVCLIVGVAIVYSERPLFFVYYDKHFYSASADTYSRFDQQPPDPAKFSENTPAMVISSVPDNPIEEADFRRIMHYDKLPIWAYSASYLPVVDHMDQVIAGALSIAKLNERNAGGKLAEWLRDHGGVVEDFVFVPVHARFGQPFVVIRKEDQLLMGVLDIPGLLVDKVAR